MLYHYKIKGGSFIGLCPILEKFTKLLEMHNVHVCHGVLSLGTKQFHAEKMRHFRPSFYHAHAYISTKKRLENHGGWVGGERANPKQILSTVREALL